LNVLYFLLHIHSRERTTRYATYLLKVRHGTHFVRTTMPSPICLFLQSGQPAKHKNLTFYGLVIVLLFANLI